MAVDLNNIKQVVKAAFEAEKNRTDDQNGSIDRIAGAIAQAASTAAVQAVNTSVISLAAPNGPVTGTITASIMA